MEAHKQSYHQRQHTIQDITSYDEVGNTVVESFRVHQSTNEHRPRSRCNEPTDNHTVENHTEEELVVVEADTVSDPWAVMVHFKHAFVALRAVVGAVRLCLEAPGAHADAAELFLLKGDDFLCFGLFLGFDTFRVVGSLALAGQRTCLRFEVFIVLVLGLFWVLGVLFDCVVCELLEVFGV